MMSIERKAQLLKTLPAMDDMSPRAQNARIRAIEAMLGLGAQLDKQGQVRVLGALPTIVSTRLEAAWWLAPMGAATRLLEGTHAALCEARNG